MPYINRQARERFDKALEALPAPRTPGELNYLLTWIASSYEYSHGSEYTIYNAIIGALECAKLEFYRRMVAPYEDEKIKENGDVYA